MITIFWDIVERLEKAGQYQKAQRLREAIEEVEEEENLGISK